MTTAHRRILATIEGRALDAGVAADELDAHIADELRVPLDHYAAYRLVLGALESYRSPSERPAGPPAPTPADDPVAAADAQRLRRLWEHVGAIHQAAVAGGDIRVVVRDHARDLIRELLAFSERVLVDRPVRECVR